MNNKMEAQTLHANHLPSSLHWSLHAVAPMLMISMGYIDPGKWAAIAEGGARFGFDLMAFMLVFNFAAILCQYISARIGVITGKDLAEICRDEYGAWTCMFLGIQTELSVIMLDLNVILGMAHILNLIFGWDLFTCVLLAATSAVFHLLLVILLDNGKAKVQGLFVSGFVLLLVAFGVIINQPKIPVVSMGGVPTKLSGESAFVLMTLLGATLVPHNFYLYSSIVQWHRGSINFSKDAMCHNHFLAIFCVFSVIYLVNNMMMSTAAYEFNGTGLVLLTFLDALSPMEQVLQSPIALLAFLLFLFISNQTTALAWNLGGEVVVRSFLKLDIPGWLHYATIRVIAVLPALYCVWSAGAEGVYQLLVFTQVVVALQLPSSVIPLFRIATSRSIMGVHKISQFMEFLALVVFFGILGLNIIFVVEMIFGNSNWVDYLRWSAGNGISAPYSVLISIAFVLFGLMLWLAIIPLKSASGNLDAQAQNCDKPEAIPVQPTENQEADLTETRFHRDASHKVKEPSSTPARALEISELHVTSEEKSHSITPLPSPPMYLAKESVSTLKTQALSIVENKNSDLRLVSTKTEELEASAPVEKTVVVDADMNAERDDDDDGDSWEAEESSKVATAGALSLTSDGPASFKSLSGKSDDGGNSIGSLSRLAGLGRAARRQLAAILDEFWGQLYDYHGQVTQDAKAKKLDALLGVDLRFSASLLKVNAPGNDHSECVASAGCRASDMLMNFDLYDSPKLPRMQSNFESSYSPRRRSSSFRTNPIELLDAYVRNSNRKVLDSGERRYSSVRNMPSSKVWDSQPATIHGYQFASYLSRVGRDRIPDNLNGQGELSSLKSPTIANTSNRDPLAFALGHKLQNGVGVAQPPGFENITVPRNSALPLERSCYDFYFSGPADNVGNSVNTKKYHSLPDISGYTIPRRDVLASDKKFPFEGSVGYGSARTCYEPPYSNSRSGTGAPLAFDKLSPSKVYRDALSSQLSSGSDTGSLWSTQPFEQFGVADKIRNVGMEGVGTRPCSNSQETASVVDIEVKLRSVRQCILKLLKLEGSDWLFRQNGGADEDLIDRVAAREKFLYEVEARETNSFNFSVLSVPHCGEGCIWRSDLIISFGVWCIHRILELSHMESRPELWGKYTYVLNRLQGVIDPAFSKPRSVMPPCFCLQVSTAPQLKPSPPLSNGILPPPPTAKAGGGKCTTASVMLDLIKEVENAISGRKGRTGTAVGDVAFPKGKENLASVLKRYKRRLSNKSSGMKECCGGSRKIPSSAPYNL